jgi:hypothetical protein
MNIFLNFIRLIVTLIKKLKFKKTDSFVICGSKRLDVKNE